MGVDFAERISTKYFNGELSSTVLDLIRPVGLQGVPAQRLLSRIMMFYSMAHIPARHFSPLGIISFSDGSAAAGIPEAMNGLVPPLTLPKRHWMLDDLVYETFPTSSGALLDVGCAFPPQTTIETAELLDAWNIVGLDPLVQPLYLYDGEGNYATFDGKGRMVAIVPGKIGDPVVTKRLFADIESTRSRFYGGLGYFADEIDNLEQTGSKSYERMQWKLVINPFKEHERANLTFFGHRAEVENIAPYTVVRCINVFMYSDANFRADFLDWCSRVVNTDSLIVVGCDGMASTEATFIIYKLEEGRLRARELCFSIDCLRPIGIMPWYCFRDDDPEALTMASVSCVLRGDRAFCKLFDERLVAGLVRLNRTVAETHSGRRIDGCRGESSR